MNKLNKFWNLALPVQKAFSVLTVLALVITPLINNNVAFAAAGDQTSLEITNISPTIEGCVILGEEITVSGTATADAPPGQLSQYHVQIDWGDGSTTNQAEASAFGGNVQGVATRSFSGTHTYSSATTSLTISARVYHQTVPGKDGDADDFDVFETCVTNPDFGNIVIEKQTDPDGDQTEFKFDADWYDQDGADFTLADGETDDSGDLEPGTYSVSEINIPDGWTLSDVTCSDGSDPSSIELGEGETVTCVFTNTMDEVDPETGTIVIEKVINGEPTEQSFDFTSDTTLGDFSLMGGGSTSTEEVLGDYSVAETVPASWNLDSAVCVYDDQSTSTPSNIVLDEDGETVTCTFTNSFDEQGPTTGTIIIEKMVTDGSDTQQAFDFNGDWEDGDVDFSLSHGQSTSTDQEPGTYSVSEVNIPDDWELQSAVCTSTDESDDSTSESINLSAGETVTCTFTNDEERGGGGGGDTDGFTLTVITSGEGGGTVAGVGISCVREGEATSGDCDETYDEDTEVTLTATPDDDSNFDGTWHGACSGTNPVCVITMTGDMEVEAHFGLDTISGGGNPGGGGGGGGGQVAGASTGPTPQVLGDQIAQVPTGAPATGAGGAANGGLLGTILTLLGLFGFASFRKVQA